jgi:hypothetical protein
MTAFIYWISRLSAVSVLFYKIAIISAIIIGISLLMSVIGNSEEEVSPSVFKSFKRRLWIPVIFYVLHILTPTTKEAVVIGLTGKLLNYIEKDTSLQQIPFKATKVIVNKLEKYNKKYEKD